MRDFDDQCNNRDTQLGRAFPATRWSLVLAARTQQVPGAERALEELCRIYWMPIYAYLRRRGYSRHDAEDLTQGFFSGILSGSTFEKADRIRGRLRTLLLTELRHHLADVTRARAALKRGGGITVVSMDDIESDGVLEMELARSDSPDRAFDRLWARRVLDRARATTREAYARRGRLSLFEALEDCLAWNEHDVSYRALASKLNLGEPAVRLQVFRLRQKFREMIEVEISQTVASPEQLKEEMAWLTETLRSGS